nr:hypothetical protein [Clavibacter michiganensis]
MTEMRILTVKQPWAWAIIHRGKDVENRSRNLAGEYRGLVAIHVGLTDDDNVADHEHPAHGLIHSPCPHRHQRNHKIWSCTWCSQTEHRRWADHGHIIGVVDLTDAHDRFCDTDDYPICSQWAEFDQWHLVLENPRPLAKPMPYRGGLGLRRLDPATTAEILAAIGQTA